MMTFTRANQFLKKITIFFIQNIDHFFYDTRNLIEEIIYNSLVAQLCQIGR